MFYLGRSQAKVMQRGLGGLMEQGRGGISYITVRRSSSDMLSHVLPPPPPRQEREPCSGGRLSAEGSLVPLGWTCLKNASRLSKVVNYPSGGRGGQPITFSRSGDR